jgi:hypothetical protein
MPGVVKFRSNLTKDPVKEGSLTCPSSIGENAGNVISARTIVIVAFKLGAQLIYRMYEAILEPGFE